MLSLCLPYVVAAVRPLLCAAKPRTEALLSAPTLPPVAVLARHLLNELAEVEEPFILVLDDYQNVRGLPVHELLTELLTHPPHAMHLVL